ncbi:MAG: ClbS/DfsB family four-helix bundle protein [Thermomicrobiales bacterium]
MADPTTKAELVEQVCAMYAAVDEAIAPILPVQMDVPGVNGAWSVKDTLAHLTFWHRNLLARFHSIESSQPPSDTAIDDDTWNRRCFDANRHRAPDDVMADLWRTQQAVLDAIEALPETIFFAAGAHGGPLLHATDGSILGHYPEHIAQIERWRDQHVTSPTMKSDLLARIADGYAAWAATIDASPPRELTLPDLHVGWSIKDEVAHVTFWEERLLPIVRAAIAGEEPPYRAGVGSAEKIEAMNADAFATSRQRSLDDVLADMSRTHVALVQAVEELPEDALFDARRFSWTSGEPLMVAIAGDTYEHYPEHTRNIQRWRAVQSMRVVAR